MNLSDLGALVDSGAIEVSTHPNDLRFAGQALNPEIVEKILTPWANLERYSDRPNYEGRNLSQWRQDNGRIRGLLLKADSENKPIEEAIKILNANGYTNETEQRKILEDLYREPVLRPEVYHSPHAKADEDVSKAVLHYSGYSPVKNANENNVQGTDLSMQLPGGKTVGVDAQLRATPRGLGLGVLNKGGANIYKMMRESPDEGLNNLIRRAIGNRVHLVEDKLLHTADSTINPIMSKFLKDPRQSPDNVKDFIISSDRPETKRIGMPRGPYNRERARGWDLIDLNRARDILLPQSYNQLIESLGENSVRRYGDKLGLVIPNQYLRRELKNNAVDIDKDVRRLFTGGMRVKPAIPRTRR